MPPFLSKTGFRLFLTFFVIAIVLLLGAIILGAFLIADENWRGAHDWAATKAKWEAKGVSFDPTTYFPPPIPDDQNLAALPLFRLEPDAHHILEPIPLRKALRLDLPGSTYPPIGGKPPDYLPDMAKISSTIAADYREAFPGQPSPPESLAQLEALYPFVSDLRTAAASRPFCLLNQDYANTMPLERPLGLVTSQIAVSKILSLDAVLALESGQSEIALEDMKVNWRLTAAAARDPSLVGGLVGVGMTAVGRTPLCDGLVLHAWSDAQLVEIQSELGRIDFLTTFQFVMRAEATTKTIAIFDFLKTNRRVGYNGLFNEPASSWNALHFLFYAYALGDWLDEDKDRLVDTILSNAQSVDPMNHRIYPLSADDLLSRARASEKSWDGYAPWSLFYTTDFCITD